MSDILGTLWHSNCTSWTFMFKWAIQKSKKMNVRHSVWFLELNVHKWNWMSISKQNVRHFWMSIFELDFHLFLNVHFFLQYVTAEWNPAFLSQAREFLFFPLLPREASKWVPIFDGGNWVPAREAQIRFPAGWLEFDSIEWSSCARQRTSSTIFRYLWLTIPTRQLEIRSRIYTVQGR